MSCQEQVYQLHKRIRNTRNRVLIQERLYLTQNGLTFKSFLPHSVDPGPDPDPELRNGMDAVGGRILDLMFSTLTTYESIEDGKTKGRLMMKSNAPLLNGMSRHSLH